MDEEIWRPVHGFEGWYEVSSFGRVRSLDRIDCARGGRRARRVPGRILKPSPNKKGYPQVTLYRDGREYTRTVHRLVARAFHGPAWRYRAPDGRIYRQEVTHLDGDPANPRPSNLCWGTKVENSADSIRHGTIACGERNGPGKLTADQVRAIRLDPRLYRLIAQDYGISAVMVCHIKAGRRWSHV